MPITKKKKSPKINTEGLTENQRQQYFYQAIMETVNHFKDALDCQSPFVIVGVLECCKNTVLERSREESN